jgi:hypothetical protein
MKKIHLILLIFLGCTGMFNLQASSGLASALVSPPALPDPAFEAFEGNITYRFRIPWDGIYLYAEGSKNNAQQDVTAPWPGDLITPDSDGFYCFIYDNSGYEWVNVKLNDNGSHNNQLYRGSSDDVKDGNAYWILYDKDNKWETPQQNWPQARNTSENAPEQPAAVYLGDTGLPFGCDSWGTVNDKWTKWRVWISQTKDLKAGSSTDYRCDKEDNEYSDSEHKTAPAPQFTATGTWYWGIQVDYGENPIAWYAQAGTTWNDMITAGELSEKANLTVNVLPINSPVNPSAQTATSGVDLSWNNNAQAHPVMIVRIQTGQSFTEPVQGTEYALNGTIGDGKVIYIGNAETWNDNAGLAAATGYTYKFYSVNNRYYSQGTATSEVTTPGSAATDHFRSNGSGAWDEIAWQSSADNELWIDASLIPTGSAASITIQEGNAVAYTGNLTLSGNFYLSKNAEFISTGTLTASKIYVKITVEEDSKWYFAGFPFAISGIAGVTLSGEPFTKGTHYDLATYNEVTRASHASGWEYGINLPLAAGKGYAFWVSSDVKDLSLTLEATTANISDAVKTSATTTLTYTDGTGLDSDKGWNFMAHPVTSSASVDLGVGNFLYTYNPVDGSYTVSEGKVTNLKPFDAYFVKTAETSNKNLSFSNGGQGSQAAVVGMEETVALYLGDNRSSYKTVVRTKTQSTDGYDALYDAPHLMPLLPQTPQIYSLIQTEKMAINSITGNTPVALGLRVPAVGTYTISWSNPFVDRQAKLYDSQGGTTVDMGEQSSYTFTAAAEGEINDRFSIQFTPTGISQVDGESLKIYSADGEIVMEGLSGNTGIRLYDLLGKCVLHEFTAGKSYRIKVPDKGIYIIEANKVRSKVICR